MEPPIEGESDYLYPARIFLGDMKPLCDTCKTRHQVYQGHVFASNAASNGATNGASNRVGGVQGASAHGLRADAPRGTKPDVDRGLDDGAQVRKQRWDRESYNAYQREYMRKVRMKVDA